MDTVHSMNSNDNDRRTTQNTRNRVEKLIRTASTGLTRPRGEQPVEACEDINVSICSRNRKLYYSLTSGMFQQIYDRDAQDVVIRIERKSEVDKIGWT